MPGRKTKTMAGKQATALFMPEKGVMRISWGKDRMSEDGTMFPMMRAARHIKAFHKIPDKKDPQITIRVTNKLQAISEAQVADLATFGNPEAAVREATAKLKAETQKEPDQELIRGAMILHLRLARDKATALDDFEIKLDGTGSRCTFSTQVAMLLGLPPSDKRATLDIKPASVNFPKGKTYTEWQTAQHMRISMQLELNEDQQQRLLFRWNLKAAQSTELETHVNLVLEALVIPPPHKLLHSMRPQEREVAEGPEAHVFNLHTVTKPIQWTQVTATEAP